MIRALFFVLALAGALLAAAVASAAGPPSPTRASFGCAAPTEEAGERSIEVGGSRRSVLVRLPADYDGKSPRPLVVVFHGYAMSAGAMESMTGFGRAWPEAIAVYPEGLPRTMPQFPGANAPGWQLTYGELGNRDLEFFDGLKRWITDRYCVDERRVYAAGYSNGAYLANLLACTRPDTIAAVAAAAGGLLCPPRAPVPVILSHGTKDRMVPHGEAVGAEQEWARQNACAESRTTAASGCGAREKCAGGDVVLCDHEGGHEYDERFTAEAVAFFRRHARP